VHNATCCTTKNDVPQTRNIYAVVYRDRKMRSLTHGHPLISLSIRGAKADLINGPCRYWSTVARTFRAAIRQVLPHLTLLQTATQVNYLSRFVVGSEFVLSSTSSVQAETHNYHHCDINNVLGRNHDSASDRLVERPQQSPLE